MPLYQTSVLKNYLKRQDKETVAKAFKKFSKYFHNTSIQQNIRESKEEQFQEGFLRELFVDILDYTLNPQPNYNLTTELKNEKGAKKADGAILLDGNALGVIELKSTKTKDLESIRQQAFDYKANQTGCVYIITSNFEKLRFYINNAVEFEEFDLFTLTESQFELLYLCLHKDNLLSNVPLKIKEASVREEEVITKKFYNDYSLFKRELFRDLVKLNMKNEVFRSEFNREDTERANKNIKHNLFKKSQKLIDRFLFIFFAEDRDLLPPNSTLKILEQWNKLKDLDAYAPLYDRFKLYFGYLDTGRKGTDKGAEIFAYNGGLFKPDPILDSLQISDELLFKHTEALSKYDFESQVDVNILGHIFENSLNEIESVNAEIEGVEFDKQKTKRKKDGVFYTPKYITKYIVDNTVGKLCAEKKAELKIIDEEYTKNRKGRTTAKLKELRDQLENYRNWLLQITICDPAAGSGAFLNQALDFLIKEHQYIDELQTSLLGGGFVFPDIENTVLENNIFGVDLNEESVEIAKLSLWLRTAQPKRKLNDLSSNIKCGNSLIDSKAVAGDKAFKWEDEFPQIFEKGGFDVVIGNPPYVNFANLPKGQREFFKKTSKVCKNKTDLYAFFVEKSTNILKSKGKFSFIFPHTWVSTTSFTPLRKLFYDNFSINSLVELEHGVFQDAVVKTVIIVCEKDGVFSGVPIHDSSFKFKINIPKEVIFFDEEMIINFDWNPQKQNIENRLFEGSARLDSLLRFTRGIKTSDDKRFLSFEKKNEEYKKIIRGRNIKAYRIDFAGEYIWYRPDLMREKVGCLPHSSELFEVPEKLITQRVNSSGQLLVTYDDKQYYFLDTTNVSVIEKPLEVDLKYILVLLNSRLINWWFNDKFKMPTISGYELHQIPIKIDKKIEGKIVEFAKAKLIQEPIFRDSINKFTTYIQSQFNIASLTNKLKNWHELTFAAFINELNKAIKTVGGTPLTKLQEMEWMEVFETKKTEAQTLKAEIDKTDKEIDKMVYELYGLSEEEIKIVEGK